MGVPEQAFTNSHIREIFDYWQARAPEGGIAGRQHINPAELPALLPYLFLVDVAREKAGLRFRVRLAGTDNIRLIGHEITGEWLDNLIAPAERDEVLADYTAAVETREPRYRRGAFPVSGREHIQYERLICPLAKDGQNVDMLVGLIVSEVGPTAETTDLGSAGHHEATNKKTA